jgi:hypothetical protein
MTESEWFSGRHPFAMLEHLVQIGRGTERKLRLFGAACSRQNWSTLNDVSREAVELGESFADGDIGQERLREAYQNVLATLANYDWISEAIYGVTSVAYLEPPTSYSFARLSQAFRCLCLGGGTSWPDSAYGPLCDLFGNPFRPTPSRDVLSPTVVMLAHSAYEERSLPNGRLMPARLSVIADALEEVGCRDPLVLAHLREWPGHYRGCWVIDWILGRT